MFGVRLFAVVILMLSMAGASVEAGVFQSSCSGGVCGVRAGRTPVRTVAQTSFKRVRGIRLLRRR